MEDMNESPEDVAHPLEPVCRRDGWTPFARKLFLSTLAETGRASLAAQYVGMSKQSAYNLRNRDPVFAAGWDAASHLARQPMADEFTEQSMDGVTETITRNGEVVAERRRHDARLSIAVLTRLDKRCEEALARRPQYLRLISHWDEWLELVGQGDDHAARAVLATGSLPCAQHGQLGQLPLASNPAPEPEDPTGDCWQDEEGCWWTDFPPPPDFDGLEEGRWGNFGYKRQCSDDEADLLDAADDAAREEGLTEAEAERDAWFAELKAELEQMHGARAGEDDESDDLLTETHGDPLLNESDSDSDRKPGLERGSSFTSQDEAPAEPPFPPPVEPGEWTSRPPSRDPTAH
jgi:hypothetical protein